MKVIGGEDRDGRNALEDETEPSNSLPRIRNEAGTIL